MYPRLYMHSVQFAHFDNCNGKIYFESRKASGRHFQFILTRNQFFNLNDAIYQIKKFNYYGHFPLGNNTWLHYNGGSDTRLYRESFAEDCRVYFSFDSFMEYIKHTHPRLLSLVRLNQSAAAAAAAATADRGERRRRLNARRRLPSISCSKSTNHKRSLSTILESSHQSSDSKRHRGRAEWATASRSTDNDVLSAAEEESAILSKWERSSDRRRSDSDSSQSSGAEDRHSPASLRCDSPSVQTAMDYK